MNNIIRLQHTEINVSFETSTHVIAHVFKVTLYNKLLGMISRYVNQIAAEFERAYYADKNPSHCGCIMRTTHGLSCVSEMKTIYKHFEILDVCGKMIRKSEL